MREILGILGEQVDEAWLDHGERIRQKGSISYSDVAFENILFGIEETLRKCGARQVVRTLEMPEIKRTVKGLARKSTGKSISSLSVQDQLMLDDTRATIERSLLQLLRVNDATRPYIKSKVAVHPVGEQEEKYLTAK
jgi:hypothetical protein